MRTIHSLTLIERKSRMPQIQDVRGLSEEPIVSDFARDFAIHRKRWALERSPGENDGGDCEKSPRIEYFMQ